MSSEVYFEIIVGFVTKETKAPLNADYKVRMYNTDFFGDEYMTESSLNDKGFANFRFPHSAFLEWDLERHADFYFVLYKADKKIFHTKLTEKDIADLTKLTIGDKEMVELGTFEVEEN